jgi:hypothetical protein
MQNISQNVSRGAQTTQMNSLETANLDPTGPKVRVGSSPAPGTRVKPLRVNFLALVDGHGMANKLGRLCAI